MQQESNVIISSTEAAKAADAELNKSASAESQQDENISEESETTEQEDQAEETEGSETEQEDEAEDQEDSKAEEINKKHKGVQKKINKLVRKVSERDQVIAAKDQEIEHWKKEALKGKSEKQPDADKQEQSFKNEQHSDGDDKPKAPRAADFESYDAYEAARDDYQEKLADWKIEQREKAKEVKSKQVEAKSEYEKTVQIHNDRIKEFKKTQTDFDEVVGDFIEDLKAQRIGPTVAVEQAIMRSEIGPQIVYELAMKPQEFARINSLSAIEAAMEIGKLEARLSKASESQTQIKTPTKAPAPINPVGKGYSKIEKSLSDPNISFSEYERIRLQQMKNQK